ncbi:FERM domain-containing protein 8 [Caerostris darwini]|uniref:FERM domain-containing protein 8 n=1 Tax=Caerostris darwini TaxID=1538125 RepID=A0AAV4S3M5_9ARAC|nr:FERM domain-containing protein 8 [Caerostris darwini]
MENELRYFENRTVSRNRAIMRCGETGFEYPPHSFHYSPHAPSTGPLQISDDRVPEWELPRSYPVGYRTVHPEYIPRHLIPTQPSQACYLPNASTEWRRETNPRVQKQVKKEDICVMLMNKVVLCVELENSSQATVQELMELILQDDQDLSLPASARDVFSLWLVSPMLELQLTSYQRPYHTRQQWMTLLLKYTSASTKHLDKDEPELFLRRNVFYDKQDEMRICDMKILELLYEEAKFNVLKGRYPCDIQDCDVLAGIQARLELGPYNPQIHTAEFFRSKITDYLPDYACKNRWAFLNVSAKPGPEHRLLDRYRSIPTNTIRYKLLRKYLEFCWALPYYGSAFFHGQIEKPAKGLALLLDHYDKKVLIGINREGVHIIDAADHCLLLSMKFRNLSWDYAAFKQENPDCLPCLFIQFKIPSQRARDSKLIQIFSHQANMMDKLISKFVEELKQRPSWCEDQVDNFISIPHEDDDVHPITTKRLSSEAYLEEKLKRLSLTTFNESGKPVQASRSWSFKK